MPFMSMNSKTFQTCVKPITDCCGKVSTAVSRCRSSWSSKSTEESSKLIIKTQPQIPVVISVETVNPSIKRDSVPFEIPLHALLQSAATLKDEEESPCYTSSSLPSTPCRSRSASTLEVPLGNVDASLYSDNEDGTAIHYPTYHIGRLWYNLHYNYDTEKLQVEIIEAQNLPYKPSLNLGFTQDFFIRVCLSPDDKRFAQTVRKRDVRSSTFDECFTFQLSQTQIDDRCLKFMLLKNTPAQKNQPIGFFFAPISPVNAAKPVWHDFDPYDDKTSKKTNNHGKLNLSLMYNQRLKKLILDVFDCSEVTALEPASRGAYLRCEMNIPNKNTKVKRSNIFSKKTPDYELNQTFKFSTTENQLNHSSLSITLLTVTEQKHEIIGKILLGGYTLATGSQLEHWQKMIDHPNQQHSKWHCLS